MAKLSEMKGTAFDGRKTGYVPPKKLSISRKLKLQSKHVKNIDPKVLETVNRQDLPLVEAVKRKVFCEPDAGLIDFVDLRRALEDTGFDGYLMVEQDMYRPDHDAPLPIARRTREYLEGIGLGDT